jgi:putative oxidoreductase
MVGAIPIRERWRRDFWVEHVPETFLRHQVRWVTGLVFFVFGLMKAFHTTLPWLLGAPELHVSTGAEGFARVLEGLGIPFPILNAWVVIVLEPLCGLGLIVGAWTRGTRLITWLSALPMAGDMSVALSVGVRQVRGQPVILDGFAVMNQPWRLPLEVALLLCMLYLVWRPAAPPRTVPSP